MDKVVPGEINHVTQFIKSYDINLTMVSAKKVPVAQIEVQPLHMIRPTSVHSSAQQIILQLAAMAKDFSGAGQFFQLFDNNDSGIVSVGEFHKAIREVWGDEFRSQTELDAAFAKLDSHFDPIVMGRSFGGIQRGLSRSLVRWFNRM